MITLIYFIEFRSVAARLELLIRCGMIFHFIFKDRQEGTAKDFRSYISIGHVGLKYSCKMIRCEEKDVPFSRINNNTSFFKF